MLYRDLDCAWLRREAAAGVEAAARWLAQNNPDRRLLVLDALRPQRVQQGIWAEIAGTPASKYFADPQQGSIHSYGMEVDITLLDSQGRECDMGSGFDEMHPRSHPALDAEHLALGVLRAEQLIERGWLHAAMSRGGFRGISTEWWHFDHGDRDAPVATRAAKAAGEQKRSRRTAGSFANRRSCAPAERRAGQASLLAEGS